MHIMKCVLCACLVCAQTCVCANVYKCIHLPCSYTDTQDDNTITLEHDAPTVYWQAIVARARVSRALSMKDWDAAFV